MASGKRENEDVNIETASPNIERLDNVDLHDKALNAGAQEAAAQEHSLGFIQGFKTYRRAAFWSVRELPYTWIPWMVSGLTLSKSSP